MGTRLVTVATFDQVVQAQMAADALRDAGIDAAVADAEVASMHWGMSIAVGGIKVQVREEDAERAAGVLSESADEDEAGLGPADDGTEPDWPGDEEPLDDPPEYESFGDAPPTREENAGRQLRVAWYGVLIPPAWLYAAYLWQATAFGDGSLSPADRKQLWRGAFVLLLGVPMTLLFLRSLLLMVGVKWP